MFDTIFKTKLSKINDLFDSFSLKAGIVFNEGDKPIDKIMFTIKDGLAVDVFSDEVFSLESGNGSYVGFYISLSEPIQYFFKKYNLNLAEMYLVYKRFIKDEMFIKRNLDFFDMTLREIGYKGKLAIAEKNFGNPDKQNLYYNLLNIINYKEVFKVDISDEKVRK